MENREYTVVIKPTAIHRLASHVEFLARVSEGAASSLLDEYGESIVFLESNPESCPPYIPKLPIDAKLRYKLFWKRYRIVYEIIGNTVYVYIMPGTLVTLVVRLKAYHILT